MNLSLTEKKPHKERIAAWIHALESGEYTQTKGALRSGEKYCCLGVACDISGVGEWTEATSTRVDLSQSTHAYLTKWDHSELATLPDAVADWYGIEDNPILRWTDEEDYQLEEPAAVLNDDHGTTFPEIAQALREKYL